VLADIMGYLRCPHCAGDLSLANAVVRCGAGHAFDVARQGYVSLLTGSPRAATGDSAPMVAARDSFLATGHLDPLADALAGEARRSAGDGCVVDLGAGTGWQLARMLDSLPSSHGVALDVSGPALRRAARAHPRIGAVGCDVWGPLPLRDEVAGLILNVFAPRNGAEMARVLRLGGALVVVTPTPRHLEELVPALGLLSVDSRKEERLERALGGRFQVVRADEVDWRMTLTADDLEALVAMGPSAAHVDSAVLRERIAGLPLHVDVSASVSVTVCELSSRSPRCP
jgi:23S rRNA (guanine745-N1)-methyltransferase